MFQIFLKLNIRHELMFVYQSRILRTCKLCLSFFFFFCVILLIKIKCIKRIKKYFIITFYNFNFAPAATNVLSLPLHYLLENMVYDQTHTGNNGGRWLLASS
jgi:hypothetical protein